jgi:hypothetical protein
MFVSLLSIPLPLADAGFSQSLQAWAGPVQAIATVLLLPVLLLYVRKAWQTAAASGRLAVSAAEAAEATKIAALQSQEALRELQAARAAEAAPYVIAYLDITEEHLVYAVVKNIGRSPARDVSIHFDPPLSAGDNVRQNWDLPDFLTSAIPFFPPQYELRSILGVALDLFAPDSRVPTEYETRIAYTDAATQAAHTETYTLDLGVFRHARSGRATTLTDIHAILQQVGEEQRSLADGMDAVRNLLHAAPPAPALHPAGSAEAGSLRGAAESVTDPFDTPFARVAAAPPHNPSADVAGFRELCAAWRKLGERRRWESAGLLQQRLRELPSSSLPAGPGLVEVLQHRFYLDGGESLRAFDQAVESLLAAAEAV